jgi:hypothetical protein
MVADCKKKEYDKNYISAVAVTSKRANFIIVVNIAYIKIIG